MSRTRASIVVLCLFAGVPASWAQDSMPDEVPLQPDPKPEAERPVPRGRPGLLAGPGDDASRGSQSIVRYGLDGRIAPLDSSPEEAALKLLDLSSSERAKIDTILTERAAILDGVVQKNIGLLLQVRAARDTGDEAGMREALDKLLPQLQPLQARGRSREEIAAALPPEQAKKFNALLMDYWTSVLRQAREDATDSGMAFDQRAFMRDVLRDAVGREIRASYDRIVGQRIAEFDALLRELALPPAKEDRIRTIATDFAVKTELNPTDADRAELVRMIFAELNAEERQRLIEIFRRERGE
ncbi:MAG: hypothetical protein RBS39_07130 [Phycisphaerales bacterium]|jgi:hypothetical protein|nr:hypothetical protein [Phycisphaerales bacterium]